MSFVVIKTWDDRKTCDRKKCINGRTWIRRIQWLEDEHLLKLKFDDGETYKEVLTDQASAKTIWDRFKSGQSIADCISILGNAVPKSLQSRRATTPKPVDCEEYNGYEIILPSMAWDAMFKVFQSGKFRAQFQDRNAAKAWIDSQK